MSETVTLPPRDPESGRFVSPDPTPAPDPAAVTPPTPEPKPDETTPEPKPKGEPEDLTGINQLVGKFLDEPEPTTTTPPAKKETKKAAPAAPAAKPKPAPTPPPTPEDDDERTTRIAEKVATAVGKALAPKQTEPPKPQEPDLAPDEQRRVQVLERMEALYPEQYKGIATKYKTSLKKLIDYADDWQKKNPGQEFDESAQEHEDFYKQNDVDWSDDHYIEAVADIRADTKVSEATKTTNQKLSEIERKEKLREAAPEIFQTQTTAATALWQKFGDKFKDLVKPDGSVDHSKMSELAKADPVTFEMRLREAQTLDYEIGELHAVMRGLAPYNEKNPAHVELSKFAEREEAAMLATPAADRINDKQQSFLPAVQYWKLTKEQRAKHWTFSPADLAALRAAERARNVNKLIEQEEQRLAKFAESRGYKLAQPSGQTPPEPTEEPPPHGDKPVSPSSAAPSKMAASREAGAGDGANPLTSFADRFLG